MSTRASINFVNDRGESAWLYQHCDGHPSDMLPALQEFLSYAQDCEAVSGDSRMFYPGYLAAEFIVWHGIEFGPLGIQIDTAESDDAAFIYRIDCDRQTAMVAG
jgi:hypothetical protein